MAKSEMNFQLFLMNPFYMHDRQFTRVSFSCFLPLPLASTASPNLRMSGEMPLGEVFLELTVLMLHLSLSETIHALTFQHFVSG